MATKAEIQEQLKAAQAKHRAVQTAYDAADTKDWDGEAQGIVKKLYGEFPSLKKYLDKVAADVVRDGYVISPLGRRRILFRVFTGSKKFIGDAQRRAKNAPVQGIGSEVGVTAAYLVLKHMDDYARHFDLPRDYLNQYQYQRAVHDANYGWAKYHLCIPALMINLWCATYGVTEYYAETFGMRFNVEPEIEIDVGASGDACYTWDYQVSNLPKIYRDSLNDMVKLGRLKHEEVEGAYAEIWEPWVNAEKRTYLLDRYPLLGLHPSTEEGRRVSARVLEAVRAAGFKPER